MSDFRYENLPQLIKDFSELRDKYLKLDKEKDDLWDSLDKKRDEIVEYLQYHGLEISNNFLSIITEPKKDKTK